jgi:hypothetical protein
MDGGPQFLTSATDGKEWSPICPYHLIPWEKALGTHLGLFDP